MHLLQVNKAYCLSHADTVLQDDTLTRLQQLISRRRQGEPIAYLTGTKEFWSLELQVSADVLIPRPETELLVELALQLLPKDEAISVADLGTGSGAIAVALAFERPQWHIVATDRSFEALQVAQNNAQRHHLCNIQFVHSDWYSGLGQQRFAAIISNPPYIAVDDVHLKALSYEPNSALTALDDGYADITQIILHAREYLVQDGLLLLEHGYNQGLTISKKLYDTGFDSVKIFKDLAGLDRVTIAT